MKTFRDLAIGDRIYVYLNMKITYYTITNISHLKETETSYDRFHNEITKTKLYTIITYVNTQNKENDIEFKDIDLDNSQDKTNYGGNPIFADRDLAIKYVTDLFDYRLEKLKQLEAKYDKERSYVEKYKECLKNIPD